MKSNFLLLCLLAPSIYAGTKLIVLGSGTPNPDPNRAGSAYALVVNEIPYLIDFGQGLFAELHLCLLLGEEKLKL